MSSSHPWLLLAIRNVTTRLVIVIFTITRLSLRQCLWNNTPEESLWWEKKVFIYLYILTKIFEGLFVFLLVWQLTGETAVTEEKAWKQNPLSTTQKHPMMFLSQISHLVFSVCEVRLPFVLYLHCVNCLVKSLTKSNSSRSRSSSPIICDYNSDIWSQDSSWKLLDLSLLSGRLQRAAMDSLSTHCCQQTDKSISASQCNSDT